MNRDKNSREKDFKWKTQCEAECTGIAQLLWSAREDQKSGRGKEASQRVMVELRLKR